MSVNTEWNLGSAGDEIYAELIDAHAGLTEVESRRLDLRLILLLPIRLETKPPYEKLCV